MKKLFLLVAALGAGLWACHKQTSPKVGQNAIKERQDFDMEACQQVSLLDRPLRHANVLALFRCTGWRGQFQALYGAIEEMGPAHWDHLMGPLDEAFMQDKQRRDRLFSWLKQLDAEDGLDDFSSVVTALHETDFFSSLDMMFSCAADKAQIKCKGREGRIVERGRIMRLLQALGPDPATWRKMSQLLKGLARSMGPDAATIRQHYAAFIQDPDFLSLRPKVADELMGSFLRGEVREADKKFYPRLFLVTNPASKGPWIKDWLGAPSMEAGRFSSALLYPVRDNPRLLKDLQALHRGSDEALVCASHPNSPMSVALDLKACVTNLLKDIHRGSPEEIYKKLLQEINMLTMAREFCPAVSDYKQEIKYYRGDKLIPAVHSLDFNRLMTDSLAYLKAPERLELVRYLVHVAVTGPGDSRYLLQEVDRPLLGAVLEMTRAMDRKSPDFLAHIYPSLRRLEGPDYAAAGGLLARLLDHEGALSDLAHLWNFYSQQEKDLLFRFFDRHFEKDANFPALFNFYANVAEEMAHVGPDITGKLLAGEEGLERTYEALEQLTARFSKRSVLVDSEKFFTAKHILRIMRIITRGLELRNLVPLSALPLLVEEAHLKQLDDAPFKFTSSEGTDAQALRTASCAQALTQKGIGLYEIMIRPPSECEARDEFSNWLFQSMNSCNADYAATYAGERANFGDAPLIFDRLGILGPRMLSTQMATMIIAHNTVMDSTGRKAGIPYVLETLRHHLFEIMPFATSEDGGPKGAMGLIRRALLWASKALRVNEAAQLSHRHGLIKEYTRGDKDNFEGTWRFFSQLGRALQDYSEWVEGPISKSPPPAPSSDCAKAMNTRIGGNPCPSAAAVKNTMSTLLKLAVRDNGGKGTALDMLIQGAIPGHGVSIPYEDKAPRRQRLTPLLTISSAYDLSDKDYIADVEGKRRYVNRLRISYSLPGVDKGEENEALTTAERVEIAIRDVRFDGNYLGARYANSVSRARDYSYVVTKNRGMMAMCVPLRFCGKTMKSDEHLMAQNALSAFNGLLESGTIFGYADFMQALITTMVASSSPEAQKDAMAKVLLGTKVLELPKILSLSDLEQHNGQILIQVATLSGLSNLGRFVRDRVGRTRQQFQEFIKGREFYLINEGLLRNWPLQGTQKASAKLARALLAHKDSQGNVLDHAIEWLYGLSYEELRTVESTVFDLMVINAFLGAPSEVVTNAFAGTNRQDKAWFEARYRGNNLYHFMERAFELVPHFFVLKRAFPSDAKLIDFIRRAQGPVRFLKERLLAEHVSGTASYYYLVNEALLALREALLGEYGGQRGHDILLAQLSVPEVVKDAIGLVRALGEYASRLHYLDDTPVEGKSRVAGRRFRELGTNIRRLAEERALDLSAFKDYLRFTTSPVYCQERDPFSCSANPHYDDPAKLLRYLASPASPPAPSGSVKLERALEELIKERGGDLESFLMDVLASTKLVPKR